MAFPAACPNCSAKLKATEKHVGRTLSCPKCKQPFKVKAPVQEVIETFVELPTENPAPDPLMDADLGNLDLGDLGTQDIGLGAGLGDLSSIGAEDFGDAAFANADFAGHGLGNLVSPGGTLASSYAPAPQQPSHAAASQPANERGMSRALIGAIVAGGAGALLLLVGIIVLAVWLLKPSSDSADQQIAAATATSEQRPAASAANTEAALPEAAPPAAPASASSAAPKAETWETFVQEENANKMEVYASFAPRQNGVREVLIASTEQKKRLNFGPTQRQALPPGSGLQLVALPTWQWKVSPVDDPDLVVSAVDGDGYRLTRMQAFGVPFVSTWDKHKSSELRNGGFRADHKHLWSSDGKTLYVVAGNPKFRVEGPKQLLKVNAETWQVELRAAGGIEDISWCSEGIAMMTTGGGELYAVRDSESTLWLPLTTSKRQGATLAILDPETLMAKKAWSMARMQRIAGCTASDIVYAVSDNSYLAAIDVKSGASDGAAVHERRLSEAASLAGWKVVDRGRPGRCAAPFPDLGL